ncbi:MAG: helix-turn-helix domain-containing protein [Lentisphaeria bacterium]|nr:helix-turn-helix domain-containing protein [Lentisphaeria bacterium]
MLDFGTEMNTGDTPDTGDLFENDGAAVAPAEENEKTAPPAAAPARRVIKPPVLPQYSHPDEPEKKKKPAPAGLKGSPHFLHLKRKSEEFSDKDKVETARILKAARSAAGLSLEDVEKATQIRPHHLTALESADFDSLPRPVYVLAYLRKLCELYDVPEDEENMLVRPWRNMPCELPGDLSKSIQPDTDNEQRKVLHQLEVALLALGGIIVLGIVVLVVVLVVSYVNKNNVPQLTFENTKILELQEKPRLQMPQ